MYAPIEAWMTAEDIATGDFAMEFPQRYEDDYLHGDAAARDGFIRDAVEYTPIEARA